MFYLKNSRICCYCDSGRSVELPHNYMDKHFVLIYNMFALCDDNILYKILYKCGGSVLHLEPVLNGSAIANANIMHNHLFYSKTDTSELYVCDVNSNINIISDLVMRDLNKVKCFSLTLINDVSVIMYNINNKLAIQTTFPQCEPKTLWINNVIDFGHDDNHILY